MSDLPGAYRFLPPLFSPLVWRIVSALSPMVLRARDGVVAVRFATDADAARFHALRGRAALFLPNHPSETEPSVLAALSAQVNEPFFYLATHELFHGAVGWLVRRMGAFSVRRGWPDRAALRMCQTALGGGRKLVIFPEGETHMRNDAVLPLYQGTAHTALRFLAAKERTGERTTGVLPVVPLMVTYRYVKGAAPLTAITRGIDRLEKQLGIAATGEGDDALGQATYRARRAAVRVLGNIEREYGVPSALIERNRADIDARIAVLYARIEARIVATLQIAPPRASFVSVRMRALFNAAFDYQTALANADTPYEKRLHARRLRVADTVLADLARVQNFMAAASDSLGPDATLERVGEILHRLEREVYGTARTQPLREAVVCIGEPMDLSPLLPLYRENRKRARLEATSELETRLRALLKAAS